MKFGRHRDKDIVYRGPITIGDYAVIGLGSIVLPGVTIGRGSIIGAGVSGHKGCARWCGGGGNPAKVICTTDEWWDKSREQFTEVDRRP